MEQKSLHTRYKVRNSGTNRLSKWPRYSQRSKISSQNRLMEQKSLHTRYKARNSGTKRLSKWPRYSQRSKISSQNRLMEQKSLHTRYKARNSGTKRCRSDPDILKEVKLVLGIDWWNKRVCIPGTKWGTQGLTVCRSDPDILKEVKLVLRTDWWNKRVCIPGTKRGTQGLNVCRSDPDILKEVKLVLGILIEQKSQNTSEESFPIPIRNDSMISETDFTLDQIRTSKNCEIIEYFSSKKYVSSWGAKTTLTSKRSCSPRPTPNNHRQFDFKFAFCCFPLQVFSRLRSPWRSVVERGGVL